MCEPLLYLTKKHLLIRPKLRICMIIKWCLRGKLVWIRLRLLLREVTTRIKWLSGNGRGPSTLRLLLEGKRVGLHLRGVLLRLMGDVRRLMRGSIRRMVAGGGRTLLPRIIWWNVHWCVFRRVTLPICRCENGHGLCRGSQTWYICVDRLEKVYWLVIVSDGDGSN